MLDEEGYRAASRNTLNAHYTDAAYVQAIWAGLAAARIRRRAGAGAGLRLGDVHRLRPGRGGDDRGGAGPDHGGDLPGAVPRCHGPGRELRRDPCPRRLLRRSGGQRPLRSVRAQRPGAQPRRPLGTQPLPAQEPAPHAARWHGRPTHVPLHPGRAEPGGAARTGPARGPGVRPTPARGGAPARCGHGRRHRPSGVPPARPRRGAGRRGLRAGRAHTGCQRRGSRGQRVLRRPPGQCPWRAVRGAGHVRGRRAQREGAR